jgi:hypothetical protein
MLLPQNAWLSKPSLKNSTLGARGGMLTISLDISSAAIQNLPQVN